MRKMPLFTTEIYYCPNRDCPYDKKMKQGERCPECATEAKPFGFRDATELSSAKKKHEKITEKLEKGSVELLITENMTDEEIRRRIYEDMVNLAGHEAGTGWMRLGTLLSGNSTDQILGAGLKALIDQNKILIRQNELILRALTTKALPPPP
jgi:hypothetical protein